MSVEDSCEELSTTKGDATNGVVAILQLPLDEVPRHSDTAAQVLADYRIATSRSGWDEDIDDAAGEFEKTLSRVVDDIAEVEPAEQARTTLLADVAARLQTAVGKVELACEKAADEAHQ